MTRNRYDRMSPRQLSRALDDLHLSAGQFARLAGHQRRRVLQWLNGTEDIPHHVFVMAATWCAFPGTLAFARQLADDMIIEEESDDSETVGA